MHANDQACEILEIASKLPKTAEILTDIWEYLTIGWELLDHHYEIDKKWSLSGRPRRPSQAREWVEQTESLTQLTMHPLDDS